MIVDEESQQAPQLVDHQFHRLSVYREVPCAIHNERLLRCQRRKGEYRPPEKGAHPNIVTVQSDSLTWIVFRENRIACLPPTDVTQSIGKGSY